MSKLIISCLFITILMGCGTKSSSDDERIKSDIDSLNDTIQINEVKNKHAYSIKDTLQYYFTQKTNLPPDLYQEIFGHELSDIDKAYVQAIKMPVKSLVPVIVVFKTVESDREKEYIDLHLFGSDWTLKKSLSLDYEISYDLFQQEHRFLSDSVLEIIKYEGLSYDNDSTVETILTLEIDEDKIFDTVDIQIDTVNY